MKQAGKRHALLVFRRRYRNQRGLYFFVAFLFCAFYVALNWLPASFWERIPWGRDYDWILLVVVVVVFLIALFRLVAGGLPYVQCTENNLKIQTPLYPIVISYKRMKETRPNPLFQVFQRDPLSRTERRIVLDDKVSGQTALVIDMASWPMSLRYLKFGLGNLMFTPDNRGLVLWVEDWMALNRELGDFKDRWRDRKTGRGDGPSASLYGQIMHDK